MVVPVVLTWLKKLIGWQRIFISAENGVEYSAMFDGTVFHTVFSADEYALPTD